MMLCAANAAILFEIVYSIDVLTNGGPLFFTYSTGSALIAGFISFVAVFAFSRPLPEMAPESIADVKLIEPEDTRPLRAFLLRIAPARSNMRIGVTIHPHSAYLSGYIAADGQAWKGDLLLISLPSARVCTQEEFKITLRHLVGSAPQPPPLAAFSLEFNGWVSRANQAGSAIPFLSAIGMGVAAPAFDHIRLLNERRQEQSVSHAQPAVEQHQLETPAARASEMAKSFLMTYCWPAFCDATTPGFHSRREDWPVNLSLSFVRTFQSTEQHFLDQTPIEVLQGLLEALEEDGLESPDISGLRQLDWNPPNPAIDLFPNAEELEQELTTRIRLRYCLT